MDANNEKTGVGQKSGGVIQLGTLATHARKELVMHIDLRRWTALSTGGTSNLFAPDHDGLHQCHSAEGDAARCSTYGNHAGTVVGNGVGRTSTKRASNPPWCHDADMHGPASELPPPMDSQQKG